MLISLLEIHMEVEMETSNVAVATNGIVPLSNFEIELVSGGKSLIQKIWDTITGIFNGDSAPPPSGIQISISELGELQRNCLEAGGDFTFTSGYATGGVNLR